MKKLIILLSIFSICLTVNCQDVKVKPEKTPGYYLQKASGNIVSSYAFYAGGIASFLIASNQNTDHGKSDRSIFIVTGLGFSIAAITTSIVGFAQIGKAGRLMQMKNSDMGVYLNQNNYGFGIAFRF